MPLSTLASTEELARHPEWRVFDCRHELGQPELGEWQYREAHIPGALYAHLDRDLSAPKTGLNGRHPLPDPRTFAAWLATQGLQATDQVVCHDAGGGTMAARLWWMLRWIGHDAVAVLDGGFAKWAAEGRPTTREVSEFAPSAYAPRPRPAMRVDAAFVESRLGLREVALLDARAPARFRGDAEPIDPVAGRIPGARNRFCTENLTAEGRFKSAQTLKGEFATLLAGRPPEVVVHYCGSGVAACHNALAMEIAGLSGSRVYPGSWSEWIADPRRPRESS